MKAKSANRYPPELRERAISSKIGCHYDTLRAWLRQHKTDVHGDVSPARTDGGD